MVNILLENTKEIQNNFLGLNAVYHGYAGFNDTDGRVYSEKLCDLEADRAADLGVKIARTYYKWIAYDFEKQCWDWENSHDFKAFCRWAKRLKDRNIDIAINAGWCNMTDITGKGWGGRSPLAVEDDWGKSVENYAAWVSETVHQLVEVRGLTNVKYLVMFTEPQSRGSKPMPKGVSNHWEAWYQAVKAADERLKKDGRRHLVKLVGPNEATCDEEGYHAGMIDWLQNKDPNLVDIYSAHNYLFSMPDLKKCRHPNEVFWLGTLAGTRIFQPVELKPNTTYTLKFYVKLEAKNIIHLSGNLVVGGFTLNENGLISAGGQPTTRLGRFSLALIDAAQLPESWQEMSVTFQTPEKTDGAAVGLFDDIKNGHKLYISCFSLKEKNSTEELLQNPFLKSQMQHWRVWPQDTRFLFKTQYDFWMYHCNEYKKSLRENDDFWFDEYNTLGNQKPGYVAENLGLHDYDDPKYGTDLAIARIAFLNAGLQSSLQWTIFDQLWPNSHGTGADHWIDGVHACGVMPCLLQSRVPKPAYYAVRVTGLVGGGTGCKIFKGGCSNGIYSAMTLQPDGTVTVLAVNDSQQEQTINFNFEKPLNCNLTRYLYNPGTVKCSAAVLPLRKGRHLKNVIQQFVDTLPPGAVVAYQGNVVQNC